jgi:hypothetical protein
MAKTDDKRITRACEGKRESRNLEFKERFDPNSKGGTWQCANRPAVVADPLAVG